MDNSLTIVFNAYHSEFSLSKVLRNLRNFKVIIIENSRDFNLKKKLEKKYKNVEIIIPDQNLGIAKGYNLAVKRSKTKYVFLNAPDIKISIKCINELLNYAKKIKKFAIIAPTFKDQKIFKNYSNFEEKIDTNLSSVKWIDNNFLIKRKDFKNIAFDENYFLYFETYDFCLNLFRKNKKMYVLKKNNFKHYWSASVDREFAHLAQLTKAWHYSWSKFYFYKKNYNYFYALSKIIPNIIKSSKLLIVNLFKANFFKARLNLLELYGIFSSIFLLKSFYRAKK